MSERSPTVIMTHRGLTCTCQSETALGSRVAAETTYGSYLNFLSQGYSVANLGYRLLAHSPAPAAAEDVREGLGKIRQITSTEHTSLQKIGIIGFSAGAHLALLAVLASSEAIRGRGHAHAVVSFWGILPAFYFRVSPKCPFE